MSTNTVNHFGPGSYTLDKLKAAMDLVKDIPPPPLFLSSSLFSATTASQVKGDHEHIVVAHPDFWAKIPVKKLGWDAVNPLFEIKIHDVDPREGDSAPVAEQKRDMLQRFSRATYEVMERSQAADASPNG